MIDGAGSSFCSGEGRSFVQIDEVSLNDVDFLTDLKETLAPLSGGKDPEELQTAFEELQDVTRLMACASTVFIASLRGWAIGGGAEVNAMNSLFSVYLDPSSP